jgi:CDP-paratose 2-epimerase
MSLDGRSILITGGAGFIGTNIALRALQDGARVVIVDDLSRAGVQDNLDRLNRTASATQLGVLIGDVRDPALLRTALDGIDTVFHLAAQVAVTTSLAEPEHDFSINLGGTLNLLEQMRRLRQPPALLFTSTNKVYGGLHDLVVTRRGNRYAATDRHAREGIDEGRELEFCSPYGCSKGGADQYVLDYARTFGLPATVFRMSCIYGPHQCGTEDQGWIAHFLLRAMAHRTITIFGDGMQVRDVLYVDDLVDAMDRAVNMIDRCQGEAFNIGGGPKRTLSLLELVDIIARLEGRRPDVDFQDWRVSDQRWFVSDTRKFSRTTGWSPAVDVAGGVGRLHHWLHEHQIVECAGGRTGGRRAAPLGFASPARSAGS